MRRNGTPEEYVLRFFAYLNDYQSFDHSVIDFLNKYMERSSKSFDYDQNLKIFSQVFSALAAALPDGLTRGQKTRTPANLFEAVSVGAGLIVRKGKKLNTAALSDLIGSDELRKFTSAGSNNKNAVRKRIEISRDALAA